MPENLSDKVDDWRTLVENLRKHLEELPHLAKDHAELAEVIVEAIQLESRKAVCMAELRKVNRRRYDLAVRGRGVRNRLAAGVQSAFGLENKQLIQFGVKPRSEKIRRRGRLIERPRAPRKKAAATPAVPAPTDGEGLEPS